MYGGLMMQQLVPLGLRTLDGNVELGDADQLARRFSTTILHCF